MRIHVGTRRAQIRPENSRTLALAAHRTIRRNSSMAALRTRHAVRKSLIRHRQHRATVSAVVRIWKVRTTATQRHRRVVILNRKVHNTHHTIIIRREKVPNHRGNLYSMRSVHAVTQLVRTYSISSPKKIKNIYHAHQVYGIPYSPFVTYIYITSSYIKSKPHIITVQCSMWSI